MSRPLVVIESQYKGDVARNVAFCEAVCRWAVLQGFAPIASHLLYTRFLDDNVPDERAAGIDCGLAWAKHAQEAWFCLRPGDFISEGMNLALHRHRAEQRVIRFRKFTDDGIYLRDE